MPKKILMVDDSRFTLDMTSFVFSAAGYEVVTTTDAVKFLEILYSGDIDGVIIDINMPSMDGYSLIKKIRAGKVSSEVPVIILTTEAEAKDRQKGFESGANAYLTKPASPDEMVAQIKLLIGDP